MTEMTWHGWGARERPRRLPRAGRELLARETGLRRRPTPPVTEAEVRLREPALPEAARAALAAVVGEDNVRDDRASRLRHAGGKSYLDLVRRRRGDASRAPDAVIVPGDHDEVVAVLRACGDHRVAVVPFGGGTSVVGGVEPDRGEFTSLVALDARRLARLLDVDPVSGVARLESGLRGPDAEALLRARGRTLGHFPQSYEYATLGGFAATRSAGQASSGYGRFDDLVTGLRVATPRGSLDLGRAPASAAGPDLRELLLGSEGTLGVITELSLRVRPVPETRRYEGWCFASLDDGLAALRRLAQDGHATGALPDVARLSDATETRTTLALADGAGARAVRAYLRARGRASGCLLITGWEGGSRAVRARRGAGADVLRRAGGIPLGRPLGAAWLGNRFGAPYLRDDLLDAGALVETLETATTWARVPALHAAVRDALRQELTGWGTPPLVQCHVSHLYPTGASLYFTVVAERDDGAPEEQWLAAKRAAGDAIAGRRATITHHHAVGLDHRPWMPSEVGDLGLDALRAVKQRLDPAGILNPGKVVTPHD